MQDAPQLRPTPDRVRETLFNWLAPIINGANCLDCFAGTGVLGFEALSRGAAGVVMIETDRTLANALQAQAGRLNAEGARIVCTNAIAWLDRNREQFDIIFLDPPFASDLARQACMRILNGGHLAPGGVVYVGTPHGWEPPAGYTIRKQGKAGQVQYMLLALNGGDNEGHSDLSRDV